MNPNPMRGIEDLTRCLRRAKRRKGALLIGFDGNASLLRHPNHHGLRETAAGDSYTSIGAYVVNEFDENSTVNDAQNFVKGITKPAGGLRPDLEAIGAVAGLLKEGYLSTVIASDPDMRLFTPLQNGEADNLRYVSLDQYLQWSLSSAFQSRRERKPLFVDAGGALINGYRQGLRDSGSDFVRPLREHILAVEEELKRYLRDFDDLYCWGWCEANVPLSWMVPDEPRLTIHSIGPETRFEPVRTCTQFSYGNSADEQDVKFWDSAQWLKRLADGLRLAPASAAAANGHSISTLWLLRPLLAQDELDTLTNDQKGREIKIVGVESRQVRQRAANWLHHQVSTTGRASVLREDWNLAGLLLVLKAQLARSAEQHVIGCFTGEVRDADDDPWRGLVENAAEFWLDEFSHRSSCRLTLFCPPDVSQWASMRWQGTGVFAQSHWQRHQDVKSWLFDSLDQATLTADVGALSQFAKDIAEPATPERALPSGFVEEALESLVLDIVDSRTAPSAQREVPAKELREYWDVVVERYRSAATGLEHPTESADDFADGDAVDVEDFEISPLPREPDFEISIKPRPSAAPLPDPNRPDEPEEDSPDEIQEDSTSEEDGDG